MNKEDVELRVAAGTPAKKAAGSIVKFLEAGKNVSLLAMGAGSVNQAVKAVCIARGMVAPHGYDLYVVPAFVDEIVNGVNKTIVKFFIRS